MSEEIEFQEPITDFPLDPGQALPPPSRSNHTFKQNRNTPWRKVKVCKIITLIRGYENTLLRKVIVFKKHNFILILTLLSRLKNKILIKNKRLKPEVEKVELDQFWKGEFSIGDDNATN